MSDVQRWMEDNCGQWVRCKLVDVDEWNTLVWLLAEAQFRSSQCWPKCGGYCGLPKNHAGPCYW